MLDSDKCLNNTLFIVGGTVMYKLLKHPLGESLVILKDDIIVSIPYDPANTDYQQYLEWLAAGNTPEEWNPDGSV